MVTVFLLIKYNEKPKNSNPIAITNFAIIHSIGTTIVKDKATDLLFTFVINTVY